MSNNKFQSESGYSFNIDNTTSKIRIDFDTNVVDPRDSVLGIDKTATQLILLDQSQVPGLGTNTTTAVNLSSSSGPHLGDVKEYVFEKLIDPSVVGCENCGDKRKYTPSAGVDSSGQITDSSVLPIINKEVIAEFQIEPEAYHSFEIDLVGHRTLCDESGNCFTENINDAAGTTNINKRSWFAPYTYESTGVLKPSEATSLAFLFDPFSSFFTVGSFSISAASNDNPGSVFPPFNSELPLEDNEYDSYRAMEYHCCKCCSYYEDFQAGKITEAQAKLLCEKSNIFIPSTPTSSFTHFDYCTTKITNSRYLSYLSRKFSSTPTSVCDIVRDKINQYGTMPDPNIPQCNNVDFNSVPPSTLTNPNPNSGVEDRIVEEGELTIRSFLGTGIEIACCCERTCFDDDGNTRPCSLELDGCCVNTSDDVDCADCTIQCGGGGGGGGGTDCTDPANACLADCRPADETEGACIERQCETNPCFDSSCAFYSPCGCGGGSCGGPTECISACGDYNKCFYDGLVTGPWNASSRTVFIGYDIGIDEADPSAERISPCSIDWTRNSSRHSTLLRNFDNSIVSTKAFILGRCIEGPGDSSYNNVITNESCTYLEDAILGSGSTNYCALFLNEPLYFNQVWDDTTFNAYGGGFYANRDLRDFIYDQKGTIHFTTNVNSNFLSYKPVDKTHTIYHIEKIKLNNITYLLNYGNKPTAPAFYDNASAYLSLGYGYVSETVTTPVRAKQQYPVVKPYIYYHLPSQNYLSEYRTNTVSGTTTLIYRTYYATYGTLSGGGQATQITGSNTGNANIPVTETTYSIPSYVQENLILVGDNSDTDKTVLTLPTRKLSKEIKSIYTEKNYGLILWNDNSLTPLSKWGINTSPTPSGSAFINKYIDLSISATVVLGVTDLFKLTGFSPDPSILITESIFTTINTHKVLKVKISPASPFAFAIIDDETNQNKGTIRGWGVNSALGSNVQGICLGTDSSNQPIRKTVGANPNANATGDIDLQLGGITLTNVIQIDTNGIVAMAVNQNGDVFGWGNISSTTSNPWGGTNASGASIGIPTANGRIRILGNNLTGVKKIVCGTNNYAALKTDLKTLVLWGDANRINFDGTVNTALSKTITFTKNISDIQTVGVGGVVLFEDGTVSQWGEQTLGTERSSLAALKDIKQLANSNRQTGYYLLIKNIDESSSFINNVSLNTWPETNQSFKYTPTARISRQLIWRTGDPNFNGIQWNNVYKSTTDPVYPGLIYHSDITPINTLEIANGSRKRDNEITLQNNEYIFTYTPYESGVTTYKNYLINNGVRQDFSYITDSRDFAGTVGNFENFKFRGKILSDNITVEILNSNSVYDSQGNIVAGVLPAKILNTIFGSGSGNLDIGSTTNPIEVTINAYKFTGGASTKLVLNTTDAVFDDGTLVGSFSTTGDLNTSSGKISIILDRKFTRSVSSLNRNDVAFLFKVKNNVKAFTESITYDRTGLLTTSDFSTFAFGSVYTYLDRPNSEKARDLGRNEHELFTIKSARFATPDYASWDITSHLNNSTENQITIPFRGLQYQYAKFKPSKSYGISAEVDDYPIIRTIRKNDGKFYIQILAGAFPYYHPLVHEPALWILGLSNEPINWRNAICNRVSNWFNYVATTKWSCYIKHTQLSQNTLQWQSQQLTGSGSSGKQKPIVIGRIPPISVVDIVSATVPPLTIPPIGEEVEGRTAVQ